MPLTMQEVLTLLAILSVPLTLGVVGWHARLALNGLLNHLKDTAVIGGEPLGLISQRQTAALDQQKREAEHQAKLLVELQRTRAERARDAISS